MPLPLVFEGSSPMIQSLDLESLAIVSHYLQSLNTSQQTHYTSLARKHGLIDLCRWLEDSNFTLPAKFKPALDSSFTFIDLFAGIGGMRLAFESANGRCVFSSEWDSSARSTYFANFGEVPFGDISAIANE